MSAFNVVRMPKWGLSMEEGTVVGWLKKPGDIVAEGDELVEIETSKITNVMEATQSGTLARIMAEPGTVLEVGRAIAVLSDGPAAAEDVDAFVDALGSSPVEEQNDGAVEPGLVLRLVTVAGHEINVGTTRSKELVVVLVHGFAGDLNNWLFNIDALAAKAQVVTMDLPGHGASSKNVGDGSLSSLAATVAAVLDDLGVTPALVVGHSLGGAVVEQLSLDRPDLAPSLVLICPAGLPGTKISGELLSDITGAQRARDVKAALSKLVADPESIGADMVDGMLRYKRIDGVQAALATLRDRLLTGGDIAALNARLADMPPALVIASKNDKVVGAPDPSLLPGSWRCEWIDEVGHMPQLEKAAEVNALVLTRLPS